MTAVYVQVEGQVTRDYTDPTLVGLNFYNQYGQHDDR